MFLYLPLQSIHSPHVGNAPRRFRHMYDSSSTSGFESSDKMREALLLSVDFAIRKVRSASGLLLTINQFVIYVWNLDSYLYNNHDIDDR